MGCGFGWCQGSPEVPVPMALLEEKKGQHRANLRCITITRGLAKLLSRQRPPPQTHSVCGGGVWKNEWQVA